MWHQIYKQTFLKLIGSFFFRICTFQFNSLVNLRPVFWTGLKKRFKIKLNGYNTTRSWSHCITVIDLLAIFATSKVGYVALEFDMALWKCTIHTDYSISQFDLYTKKTPQNSPNVKKIKCSGKMATGRNTLYEKSSMLCRQLCDGHI